MKTFNFLDHFYLQALSNFVYSECFLWTRHMGFILKGVASPQRSQTRGPREGPMRPANRKNVYLKRDIGPIGQFDLKHWIFSQKKNLSLMWPARPCVQSHAATLSLRPSALPLCKLVHIIL